MSNLCCPIPLPTHTHLVCSTQSPTLITQTIFSFYIWSFPLLFTIFSRSEGIRDQTDRRTRRSELLLRFRWSPEMGAARPDWLPAGWKVAVKRRSSGKRDRYYFNPSGTKFNSKPEVLRHLKIVKKVQKPKKKAEVKKALVLPPGWIKKYKITRKKGNIRKDPYYIDPDSGRQFRSAPDVYRYLGSMDSVIKTTPKRDVKSPIYPSTRAATRMSISKKTGSENGENFDSEGENSHSKHTEVDSPVDKLSDKMEKLVDRKEQDQNLASEKVKTMVNNSRPLRSGSKVAAHKTIVTAAKNTLKQKKRKISSVTADDIPNEQPHVKGNEHHEGGRPKSKRLSEIKLKDVVADNESLQSGTESTTDAISVHGQSGEGNKTNKESEPDAKSARPSRRKISVNKPSSDSPCRNPRRHSELGVDPSLEVPKHNMAQKESTLLDGPDKANIKTYRRVKSSGKPKILPATEPTKGSQLLNEKKESCRVLSSPKVHKGAAVAVDKNKGPDAAFTADQKEQCSSKLASGNNTESSSLSCLLLDPCIEFAIKTLTGEIPIEDINKKANVNSESPPSSLTLPNQASSSSALLPCGDISADPCFEFAVKTLTGEVPAENVSKFQISLEQPWSPLINGGLHLPRFALDTYSSPSNHTLSPVAAVKTGCPGPNHGFVDGQQSGTSYGKF